MPLSPPVGGEECHLPKSQGQLQRDIPVGVASGLEMSFIESFIGVEIFTFFNVFIFKTDK